MHRFAPFPLVVAISLCLLAGAAVGGFGFPSAKGLDVFDVVADPFAYEGPITVRGGVMRADLGKGRFELVDYREYRSCRSVDCAPKWITVFYAGDLPQKGAVVEVVGTVEENAAGAGGFVLRAKGVRIK
ncbi:MAG: hypothetical protein GXP50_08805 [Deltaproteobacteria bacterium]|nr:hypothetical protein [Deltaproteobacteria bacterium]